MRFENFEVRMHPPKIFICGGPVETIHPESLREHIKNHLDSNHDELYKSLIIAEKFNDYFGDGKYENLLEFEEDIANISTLIVICLESAGSLVELGLFCNRPDIAEKLLVYVPLQHTTGNDSFIYLGPLNSLKKIDSESVASYPFPEKGTSTYIHIDSVITDLTNRISNTNKTQKFNINNTGHIALLVHDIVSITSPIKITAIKDVVAEIIKKEVSDSFINRIMYLLERMNLVKKIEYSSSNYYYSTDINEARIKFGRYIDDRVFDRENCKVLVKQSFLQIEKPDSITKKRMAVAYMIHDMSDE